MKKSKWICHLIGFSSLIFAWGCGTYEQTGSLKSARQGGAGIRVENSEAVQTTLGNYFNKEYMFVDFSRAG